MAQGLNRYLLNCWFQPAHGAGRLQVLVDAIHQFPLDLDLLFTLPLPAPCTSCIRDVATAPPTMGPEVIREVGHHSADERYFFVAAAYILEERGIWDRVKWRDGTISIHTSLGPEHLGEWVALMYYLQKS